MRAHLVQSDIAWEDKPRNYASVHRLIAETAGGVAPGDLVVLPEMFDTGFSFTLERTADTDGRTLGFIKDLAARLRATVQGARAIVGPDGRGRNRATVAGPDGSILVEYDKIHPFSYGRETEFFTGGERVVTYTWTGAAGASVSNVATAPVGPGSAGAGEGAALAALTVCPAVCYDARFPELFRHGLMKGAEVFALGANWPAPRAHHWRALLIARAIENQAFVLGVNRCGNDPHLAYSGGSIAVGPKGDVLGELGGEQGVLSVEIEVGALREWRNVFPAWRDVRLLNR
jgi:omega-amidase